MFKITGEHDKCTFCSTFICWRVYKDLCVFLWGSWCCDFVPSAQVRRIWGTWETSLPHWLLHVTPLPPLPVFLQKQFSLLHLSFLWLTLPPALKSPQTLCPAWQDVKGGCACWLPEVDAFSVGQDREGSTQRSLGTDQHDPAAQTRTHTDTLVVLLL